MTVAVPGLAGSTWLGLSGGPERRQRVMKQSVVFKEQQTDKTGMLFMR